jgi:hypothetical protein
MDCLDKIFKVIIFSALNVPKKVVFSNSRSNFHHLYHHISYLPYGHFYTTCHDFWILISKSERFGFEARGLQDMWHRLLIFSNLFEKVSKEDLKLM